MSDSQSSNLELEGVVNVEIISLEEELAGKAVDEFKGRMRETLEEGHKQIVLDCNALKTINSEGLEALLCMIEEVQKVGGIMKIASLSNTSQKVFEITQFDRIFEIYDDVLGALKSF